MMTTACRLDLHNHTPHVWSDYRSPGASALDLVDAALAAGMDVLGVTDHFAVGFCRELMEAAARRRNGKWLLVLPGVELKVRHEDDEAHLIGLFSPESEFERSFDDLMGALGVPGDALATESLPRLVVRHDPVDVARAIVSLGGICHVAHADRRFGDYTLLDSPLLERLAREPTVSAVELLDQASHGHSACLAGSTLIASSDSHRPSDIGRRYASIPLPELSFEGLRCALERPHSTVNAS